MKLYAIFFLILFCTSSSHSQTPVFPTVPTLSELQNQPAPIPPPFPQTTTVTPVAPKDPLTSIFNSIQPPNPATPVALPGPKYQEFLSICRTNDYDTIFYSTDALKEQRIKLIEDKIKLDPSSIKLKFRLLKEYVDQRKIKEADQQVLKIKATKANEDEVSLASGMVAYLKKDRKKARDYLNKTLASQPKNIEALKWLAEEYKAELNYFEALAIYDDLTKISPEHEIEGLCEVLTLDAHYAEAETICLQGSAKKKDPLFNIYLGIASREKNNIKAAQKYFRESLIVKETEMAHTCLGETYAINKKFADAEKSYLSALKIVPQSLRALTGLAWTYFNDKERIKALEYFRKACTYDKRMASEVRTAIKILLDEKADISQKYIEQAQRCSDT